MRTKDSFAEQAVSPFWLPAVLTSGNPGSMKIFLGGAEGRILPVVDHLLTPGEMQEKNAGQVGFLIAEAPRPPWIVSALNQETMSLSSA
jgi:hypothetical protein